MSRSKFNSSASVSVDDMNSLLHTGDIANYNSSIEPPALVSSKDRTIFESDGKTIKQATTINGVLPISKGGTGASNAMQARANLGVWKLVVSNDVTTSIEPNTLLLLV